MFAANILIHVSVRLLKRIKYLGLKLIGTYRHLNPEISCPHKWYGSEYGGFFVNPDLLNEQSVVYSFGIGEDVSFDEALIEEHHCQVFGFDPTPKSIQWVRNQNLHKQFHFYDYGIGVASGKTSFFLPRNPAHVSGSSVVQTNVNGDVKVEVLMKSFEDITRELKHQKIDLLKMDIEGSEYEVIDSILLADVQISQVLIEFHDRFFTNGKQKTSQVIDKMRSKGFRVFAVSDSFEEVSLIHCNALQ